MSDLAIPVPPLINTHTRYSPGMGMAVWVGTSASTTWPTANLAFYTPLNLPFPYLVRRVFWVNGSSVTSTNRDLGIYTADGTRIYSTGSTAASGASAAQYVTPGTPFLLSPGRYYIALATSVNTANCGPAGVTTTSVGLIALAAGTGIVQQASALALPATMTPATLGTTVIVPLCGITNTASGF